MGFGANCNLAFSNATGEIVVFVNSDAVVPPRWLERLLTPFDSTDVAVASPLSNRADSQSIFYGEGTDWRMIDRILEQREPTYPIPPKLSGFVIAVRKSIVPLEEGQLFDAQTFGRGYWEDTDLHYRTMAAGFRSVVVDNLFIKHISFESFAVDAETAHQLSSSNRKKFLSRWAAPSSALEPTAHISALADVRSSSRTFLWTNRRALDLLIILPLSAGSYTSGGCNVIFDIVDHLIDQGFQIAVLAPQREISQRYFLNRGFSPFTRIVDVYRNITSVRHVWATSGVSIDIASTLAEKFNSELTLFAQGPESYFGTAEHAARVLKAIQAVNGAITVSPFMSRYCEHHGLPVFAELPLGPDELKYYFTDSIRNNRQIAIHVSTHQNKAPSIAVSFAVAASRLGYEVVVFGNDTDSLNVSVTKVGQLTPTKLRELYSASRFVADFSYFEGLGLISLEAAKCGAIPIFTRKGGIDGIFTNQVDSFILDSHPGIFDLFDQISSLDRRSLDSMSVAARHTVSKLGMRGALDVLKKYLGEPSDQTPLINVPTMISPILDVTETQPSDIATRSFPIPKPKTVLEEVPEAGLRWHIDSLRNDDGVFCVTGWCILAGGRAPSLAGVLVNDTIMMAAAVDLVRQDVWASLGVQSEVACGFQVHVSVADLLRHHAALGPGPDLRRSLKIVNSQLMFLTNGDWINAEDLSMKKPRPVSVLLRTSSASSEEFGQISALAFELTSRGSEIHLEVSSQATFASSSIGDVSDVSQSKPPDFEVVPDNVAEEVYFQVNQPGAPAKWLFSEVALAAGFLSDTVSRDKAQASPLRLQQTSPLAKRPITQPFYDLFDDHAVAIARHMTQCGIAPFLPINSLRRATSKTPLSYTLSVFKAPQHLELRGTYLERKQRSVTFLVAFLRGLAVGAAQITFPSQGTTSIEADKSEPNFRLLIPSKFINWVEGFHELRGSYSEELSTRIDLAFINSSEVHLSSFKAKLHLQDYQRRTEAL